MNKDQLSWMLCGVLCFSSAVQAEPMPSPHRSDKIYPLPSQSQKEPQTPEPQLENGVWVIDLSKRNRTSATLRSVFVPGWGQAFNRQRIKGTVIFGTVVGSVVGSMVLYKDGKNSFDEYKREGRVDGSKYDDYEKKRDQSLIFGGVAGFLWVLSIIDAYRYANNPPWTKAPETQVVVQSEDHDGARLVWQKRF